jgi:hypothetical protein
MSLIGKRRELDSELDASGRSSGVQSKAGWAGPGLGLAMLGWGRKRFLLYWEASLCQSV